MDQEFTPVPNWTPPPRPGADPLIGRYVRLERLAEGHASDLFDANQDSDLIWKYLPYGPFETEHNYRDWVRVQATSTDPQFYAITNADTGKAEGVLSYLRINPDAGSIEVGHINLAQRLQKTKAATEAIYLTIKWA